MDGKSSFLIICAFMEKDNEPSLIALGEKIRAARKFLGWTQEVLADEAGIDRSYIGGVERGERNISFLILCQIAKALNKDISSLTKGIPRYER